MIKIQNETFESFSFFQICVDSKNFFSLLFCRLYTATVSGMALIIRNLSRHTIEKFVRPVSSAPANLSGSEHDFGQVVITTTDFNKLRDGHSHSSPETSAFCLESKRIKKHWISFPMG